MDNRRDADVRRRSMADNRRTIADVVLIADGVLITHYGFLVTSFRPLTVGTQATRPTRARSFAGANRKEYFTHKSSRQGGAIPITRPND